MNHEARRYSVKEKLFSLDVILSLITGVVVGKDLRTLAKFLGTYSPDELMYSSQREKWATLILVQYPALARINSSRITEQNCERWLRRQEKIFGKSLVIRTVRVV